PMKRIKRFTGFAPKYQQNKTDLVFNKAGLTMVNKFPDMWELNQAGTRLINKKDANQQVILSSIASHKVGEHAKWGEKSDIQIAEVKLMRLADITDELALRTGVEMQSPGVWKHYSPEKFYPKSVLKTQEPGFPNFNTPTGSFHSLWCKEFDIMEMYANPWIWQYTCKNIEPW
ncbi:MAG: hypothetical protein ACOYN4_05650, partial [Bacteroidales bacterium]